MAKRRKGRRDSGPLSGNPYTVFLSHATHDKWIAQVICEKVEVGGAATFRDDRDIEGGDSIPTAIRDANQNSDELVVLLTPESVRREWVLVEIGIAIGAERRIVPLTYHVDVDQIPAIIRENRGFLLNELDQYVEDLQKRIPKR